MARGISNRRRAAAAILWLLAAGSVAAQQVADTAFAPRVSARAFAEGESPRVAIDEAHFNFHTADGRYAPFAQLLRRDGFVVTPLHGKVQPIGVDRHRRARHRERFA